MTPGATPPGVTPFANTRPIGVAGVTLATTSLGVLGKLVLDASSCAGPVNWPGFTFALAGAFVGLAMAYLGRPVTVP